MDYSTFFMEAMDLWNEAKEKFRLVQDMATSREHRLDLVRLATALGTALAAAAESTELLVFDIELSTQPTPCLIEGVSKPSFPGELQNKEFFFQGDHSWEDVSQSPLYHQTRPDKDILVTNCETMIRGLPTSFRMVDLGTG
jgi:hypothetical protein